MILIEQHTRLNLRLHVTQALRAGIALRGPSSEVARQSAFVFLMLRDTPGSRARLFCEHGVAEVIKQGKIVVDMRSVRASHVVVRPGGCTYPDAPVSGDCLHLIFGFVSLPSMRTVAGADFSKNHINGVGLTPQHLRRLPDEFFYIGCLLFLRPTRKDLDSNSRHSGIRIKTNVVVKRVRSSYWGARILKPMLRVCRYPSSASRPFSRP